MWTLSWLERVWRDWSSKLVVIYLTATMAINYINEYSNTQTRCQQLLYVAILKLQFSIRLSPSIMDAKPFLARTQLQFQNQKQEWVLTTLSTHYVGIRLKVRKPSKVHTPKDYTKHANGYNIKHENDLNT